MKLLLVDHVMPSHSSRQECVREEPNSQSITISYAEVRGHSVFFTYSKVSSHHKIIKKNIDIFGCNFLLEL